MTVAQSALDRPTARAVAAAIALGACGLVGWLVYIDNREDPAVAACIKQHTAAIDSARDQGALSADVAARFLAKVAESCKEQAGGAAR
jgi:hypothetical protein